MDTMPAHVPGTPPRGQDAGRLLHAGTVFEGPGSGRHLRPVDSDPHPRFDLPWPQAWTAAHRAAHRLPFERVPTVISSGRVLAVDLSTDMPVPAFDSAAAHGWAVAGEGPWRTVGDVPVGRTEVPTLEPGQCLAIALGAMIPPGTERVLPYEDGVLRGDVVCASPEVEDDMPIGTCIRATGTEAEAGECLVAAGTVLTPAHVGLAASLGVDMVPVVRRPIVDILVLGGDLPRHGNPVPGQYRDALGPQLPALVQSMGGRVRRITAVPDEPGQLATALSGEGVDMILTTGGASPGPWDRVRAGVADVRGRILVDRVAVRPGRPMLMAALPGATARPGAYGFTAPQLVVALPGNPISALVTTFTMVWPALRAMTGLPLPATTVRRWTHPVSAPTRSHRLVPCAPVEGGIAMTRYIGSGLLRAMAGAEGLALVPPGGVEAGSTADVISLPW